ncbi:MAG: bifunctional helix-turn-helix transcriptional regulator/GNAT family N-acetyltransferase [Tagaea sp.]|nr:bifunctional helix-turn-helix transcriptional regulator/GNAT family N-acetyltransferase [Tagaea sp.]
MKMEIGAVRRFNRFYTGAIGVLDRRYDGSPFGLTEARVLYEIANRKDVTAATLGGELGLDPAHLSRVLAGFARKRLLRRRVSPGDARATLLGLSPAGRKAFRKLRAATERRIGGLLRPLAPSERRELVASMGAIERALGGAAGPVILRDPKPGDMGDVIAGQARLYHEAYGWNWEFDALVADICAKFVRDFDPAYERCWIAERDGRVVGSVFCVRQSAGTAKLRMLYVDKAARGMGLGARLVDECIAFARAKGYRRLVLWTNDILVAARKIYLARGFVLEKSEKHRSFSKNLVGQYWSLDLRS